MVLDIEGNTILNVFDYIHIKEILTNKRANSYNLRKWKIWRFYMPLGLFQV